MGKSGQTVERRGGWQKSVVVSFQSLSNSSEKLFARNHPGTYFGIGYPSIELGIGHLLLPVVSLICLIPFTNLRSGMAAQVIDEFGTLGLFFDDDSDRAQWDGLAQSLKNEFGVTKRTLQLLAGKSKEYIAASLPLVDYVEGRQLGAFFVVPVKIPDSDNARWEVEFRKSPGDALQRSGGELTVLMADDLRAW
jgi:hypothetical protein